MSDIVPNIAKGRTVELMIRVDTGDPTNARFYAIPVARGSVTDAQLLDADTFADMVTLGLTERTANGWNRKTLAAADVPTFAPDDTNDRAAFAISTAQSWTPTNAGDTVTDLVWCYGSVASPTNAQLTPVAVSAFAVTPASITETVNAGDIVRAS